MDKYFERYLNRLLGYAHIIISHPKILYPCITEKSGWFPILLFPLLRGRFIQLCHRAMLPGGSGAGIKPAPCLFLVLIGISNIVLLSLSRIFGVYCIH
jgi:hypothetical protein